MDSGKNEMGETFRKCSIGHIVYTYVMGETFCKCSIGHIVYTYVIPAKAGIHFDLDGRNMDSRFRGNDDIRSYRILFVIFLIEVSL